MRYWPRRHWMDVMKEYAEYLCGERVWGFVVKGPNSVPLACPHIGQVLQYDLAIRELQARLMKGGLDFKASLERAMADEDTRILHFTTAFGMEAHTAQCRALTAPGLNEIYGNLSRGGKRPHSEVEHGDKVTISASAKKRAKIAEKKKAANRGPSAQGAIPPPPQQLAL